MMAFCRPGERDPCRAARAAAVLLALALAGCATMAPPQPWEKGTLARPEMQFDADPLDTKITQHIYTSKEAATGGYGAGGGGCGCN
jgi:hypothetical protein